MAVEKYKPEQIVTVLRQIEVQIASGKTTLQACKDAGIHTRTHYRWRFGHPQHSPHCTVPGQDFLDGWAAHSRAP